MGWSKKSLQRKPRRSGRFCDNWWRPGGPLTQSESACQYVSYGLGAIPPSHGTRIRAQFALIGAHAIAYFDRNAWRRSHGGDVRGTPFWFEIFLASFFGLSIMGCFVAYAYFSVRASDAFRSERFYLQNLAIERGMLGDAGSGVLEATAANELPGATGSPPKANRRGSEMKRFAVGVGPLTDKRREDLCTLFRKRGSWWNWIPGFCLVFTDEDTDPRVLRDEIMEIAPDVHNVVIHTNSDTWGGLGPSEGKWDMFSCMHKYWDAIDDRG